MITNNSGYGDITYQDKPKLIEEISSAQTVSVNHDYLINNSAGTFDVLLPSTALDGESINIFHDIGDRTTFDYGINAGGGTINNVSGITTIRHEYGSVHLVFQGGEWIMTIRIPSPDKVIPGGSDTQVQFNDGGEFGGDSAFTFDKISGNVGIGTNSPVERLHVNGTTKSTSFTDGYIAWQAAQINRPGNKIELQFGATSGSNVRIGGGGSYPTQFDTVLGGISLARRTGQASIRGTNHLVIDTTDASGISMQSYTSQNIKMCGGGGNVSIGVNTVAGNGRLQVRGHGDGNIMIGGWDAGTYNAISLNGSLALGDYNILSRAGDKTLYINRPTGEDMRFRMNNSDQMILSSSGKLSINSLKTAQSHPANYKQVYCNTDTGELYRLA